MCLQRDVQWKWLCRKKDFLLSKEMGHKCHKSNKNWRSELLIKAQVFVFVFCYWNTFCLKMIFWQLKMMAYFLFVILFILIKVSSLLERIRNNQLLVQALPMQVVHGTAVPKGMVSDDYNGTWRTVYITDKTHQKRKVVIPLFNLLKDISPVVNVIDMFFWRK